MVGGSSRASASNAVIDGMIFISHSLARVLFDTDATHSLISNSFVSTLGLMLVSEMILNVKAQ